MTDQDLKQHVQRALDWEPSLDASDIGVSVDGAVVTLRGTVPTYSQKVTAERDALRIYGVRAVANELVVHLVSGLERTDTELARAAVTALTWNTMVPSDRVTVAVDKGWVELNGTLEWRYQRDAAARAVRDLTGVRGVTNDITVRPEVKTTDIRDKIEAAFKRSAEIDARRVRVSAADGKITLSGNVRSWAERQEAERAAWAAPGVTEVEDCLVVVP